MRSLFLFGAIVVATMLAISTGPAHAEGIHKGDHGSSRHFGRQDLNGDSVITRREANASNNFRFISNDRNNDGSLTLEEFGSARGKNNKHKKHSKHNGHDNHKGDKNKYELKDRLAERFKALDRNNDHRVSRYEFDEANETRFNIMDKSNDDRITLAEFNDHGGRRR